MKASMQCGVLAVLILAACGGRPDPGVFELGASQPEKAGAPGIGNASGAPASGSSGAGAVTTDMGGASSSVGGSAETSSAGDPGVAGNASAAGAPGAAGALGSAGSTSAAGSSAGGAGRGEPPPAVCGNGVIEAGEQCDDAGNTSNGCDSSCKVACSQHGQGVLESDEHHCYAGYNQGTFADSQQACVKRGAHLASVSSAAENKLVRQLVSNSKWLGASEEASAMSAGTGNYAWLTGEPLDYTNWGPQQPNPAPSHCQGPNALCYAHCVVMLGDGTWAAQRCDVVDGYVCEWEPPGTK